MRYATAPAIIGMGYYLPPTIVTSAEVEDRLQVKSSIRIPRGIIEQVSGVEERRFADSTVASSDLATPAAVRALDDAGLAPSDIDLLLFAATAHDVAEPATANIVQANTGCRNATSFDIKNACNSFLTALDVAASLLQVGRFETALVATGEVGSSAINWSINDSKDLGRKFAALTLGDGGAAWVLRREAGPGCPGLLATRSLSAGAHWELSTVMSGGTRLRDDWSRFYLECDSRGLEEVAKTHMPGLIDGVMSDLGWSAELLDHVVPHQYSRPGLERAVESLGVEPAKLRAPVRFTGNTGAASIPIALSLSREEGLLSSDDSVLLIGGAAGFSGVVTGLSW